MACGGGGDEGGCGNGGGRGDGGFSLTESSAPHAINMLFKLAIR